MKISDLVDRSGVPLATVKFYIREGMLPAGRVISARRAEYDDTHLSRLTLIRSLTAVAGLPLSRAKGVLDVIDAGGTDMYEVLGQAIRALSSEPTSEDGAPSGAEPHPHAVQAIALLGEDYAASDARMESFAQLDQSLRAAEESGLPIDPARLAQYGEHMMAIARAEFAELPVDRADAVEYAVLGTVLYEPVLAALRRLAHQNLAARLTRQDTRVPPSTTETVPVAQS